MMKRIIYKPRIICFLICFSVFIMKIKRRGDIRALIKGKGKLAGTLAWEDDTGKGALTGQRGQRDK